MLPLEYTTHTFIIKIWLEEVASNDEPALWRGRVTHVPGGERHHFNDMEYLNQILQPYLQTIGIDF